MNQPCVLTVQTETDMPILAELRRLLEPEFRTSKTENADESDAAPGESERPHAVVVDASVPDSGDPKMSGPLVVIMMRAKPESVCQVFKTASTGYVFRRCGGTQVAQSLYEMVAGSNNPTVSDIPAAAPTTTCPLLTTRQTEVLRLVADGHPDKEIASMLCISEKTVEFHKANIRKQLSLRSTAELTRFAIRNGLAAS